VHRKGGCVEAPRKPSTVAASQRMRDVLQASQLENIFRRLLCTPDILRVHGSFGKGLVGVEMGSNESNQLLLKEAALAG
jgi:hypothetical protein